MSLPAESWAGGLDPMIDSNGAVQARALAPELSPRHARAIGARQVAWMGRVGAVLVPVLVAVSHERLSFARGAAVVLLLSAVWLLTLRSALGVTHFTLGRTVAAAIGTATGLLGTLALNPWLPALQLPVSTVLATAGGVFLLVALWESFAQRFLVAKRRVLVIGPTECASALAEEVERTTDASFELLGMIAEQDRPAPGDVPRLGTVADLADVVEAQRPDLIVLADASDHAAALERLLDVAHAGFRVVGMASFFEHAFGRVPVAHVTAAWFISLLHLRQRAYTRFAKRTFDIVVAAASLVLTSPLWPLLVLLVRRTPGPVIFRQTRVGEGGRRFCMYKLRTMVANAEEPGHPRWADEDDTRVTREGRFLRRTRLDELPQLWNVLKGDMSMVGPRPERPEFVALLERTVPFWNRRLLIKPGVTGWAQIRRGYTADPESTADKLSYDLWYLRHRTLLVDLTVCAKTLVTLIRGFGVR